MWDPRGLAHSPSSWPGSAGGPRVHPGLKEVPGTRTVGQGLRHWAPHTPGGGTETPTGSWDRSRHPAASPSLTLRWHRLHHSTGCPERRPRLGGRGTPAGGLPGRQLWEGLEQAADPQPGSLGTEVRWPSPAGHPHCGRGCPRPVAGANGLRPTHAKHRWVPKMCGGPG